MSWRIVAGMLVRIAMQAQAAYARPGTATRRSSAFERLAAVCLVLQVALMVWVFAKYEIRDIHFATRRCVRILSVLAILFMLCSGFARGFRVRWLWFVGCAVALFLAIFAWILWGIPIP